MHVRQFPGELTIHKQKTLCCLGSRTVKSSNFCLKLLHCPEVFSRTRSAMMLGFSVFYSQRLPPWNKTWKFLSKFCYSGKMMHICQCHWVKKCCFKCHPDFHRNLSYTTFTFGFIIKKLQEPCFWCRKISTYCNFFK